MINNRMSLRNLLIIILLAFAFLFGCFGYGISSSGPSRNGNYFVFGFAGGCMLLLIAAVGVSLHEEWGRKLVLGILYLIGAAFAAMGFFLAKNTFGVDYSSYDRAREYLPFVLLVFAYVTLIGLISFVNSNKLKKEFEK